jgi:outer membrane protein assembly factor BamB
MTCRDGQTHRIHIWGTLLAAIAGLQAGFASAAVDASGTASALRAEAGIPGGFVVHLGCGDGAVTAALRTGPGTQVQGLDRDAANVAKARATIQAQGIYGEVCADRLIGDRLPYIDNFVNLLVVENASGIAPEEINRVVVPNGVVLTKGGDGQWTRTVKPRPDNIDDWTHYLHGADGNPVAHDDLVSAPRHLQWLGSPRWSRHHDRMASMSAMVSEGGKLIYIQDEGSHVSILLPAAWKLICRDAFNGVVLWKKDIEKWQTHLFPLKSGPTQLARRLAAVDGVVYVTLGYEAPLVALDANTGELIRTYEGSANCEEVIVSNGLVFVLANQEGQGLELREYAPLNPVVGDQANVREKWHWDEKPRVVMAYEAATGKQLWAKQGLVSPLTLSADAEKVCFHDGERVLAVTRDTGKLLWTTEPNTRRSIVTFNFGPRLVLHKDVVLYAGGDGKMVGYNGGSGKQLWTAEHPNSGYQSPQDLIVMKNLVWCAPTTSGRDSGVFTGRDLHTGEVKVEFPPNVDTYWFHHRCYIAKATDNFLIPSRTGIEFVDPDQKDWEIHHWVRGGCLYGVMPANGLLYAPPNDCSCYPEAKLYGYNAMAGRAPSRPHPTTVPSEGRLEKGPAYKAELAKYDAYGEWPTYRADNDRSGYIPGDVGKNVKQAWETKLGGRLSPPVIANGRVFVSQIDQHQVHALDAASGAKQWSFTAGARVDSPPTIVDGRVVFGCNDGWIYCLRETDGELIWRYRAAPLDERHMAWEQLESVWPVHGSVLVQDGVVWGVAGRSVFLDGGMHLVRLDVQTGEKLSETLMDDKNPLTGHNLQEVTQTLQGPVGLPDILSCNGDNVFMRSQKFDLKGHRLEIGPHSGDPQIQGSVQRGPGVHLFAPNGFLDDTWYHRSYWVYGRSFAGGHAGYYQAGKYAPSGNIMVSGGGYVYGYGRKPEHFRWTTVMERELYAAGTDPAGIASVEEAKPKGGGGPSDDDGGAAPRAQRRRNNAQPPAGQPQPPQQPAATVSSIQVPNSEALDPSKRALTVMAWVKADGNDGVILSHGGPQNGYALSIQDGRAAFDVRIDSTLVSAVGVDRLIGDWHHVAGILTTDHKLHLYVDGHEAATAQAKSLLLTMPKQPMLIGADENGAVGPKASPNPLIGAIDEVRVYHAALPIDALQAHVATGAEPKLPAPVLSLSFEGGVTDESTHKAKVAAVGTNRTPGKRGEALQFAGAFSGNRDGASPAAQTAGGNRAGGIEIERKWNTDIPIYVRGMALADQSLCLIGPPDFTNEHDAFASLSTRDPKVLDDLANQDAALKGAKGSQLLVVNADSGERLTTLELNMLPVWDGLAASKGRLYLSTSDGRVVAFAGE